MGKESLIKSTTKQESTAKPEDVREQDTSGTGKTQTRAQTKPKSQPGKTAAAAKKPAAKPKPTSRKKPAAKAKTTAPKKPTVKAKAATRKKTPASSKPTVAGKKSAAAKAKSAATSAAKTPPKKTAPEVKETKPIIETVENQKKAVPEKEARTPETPISAARMPPGQEPPADPANRMMLFGLGGFALLMLLVIIASWLNTQEYYIKPGEGAIEIWQGNFAPKGAKLLMSIPGIAAPEPSKDTYSKSDVYPIFYQYHLDKADTLLEVPGMPDFEGVKSYLHSAQIYATTSQMKSAVKNRLSAISRMVLLYKAEVAASKDTLEDLKSARSLYKEARGYAVDKAESARIKLKIEDVDRRLDKLKSAAALEKKSKKSK